MQLKSLIAWILKIIKAYLIAFVRNKIQTNQLILAVKKIIFHKIYLNSIFMWSPMINKCNRLVNFRANALPVNFAGFS